MRQLHALLLAAVFGAAAASEFAEIYNNAGAHLQSEPADPAPGLSGNRRLLIQEVGNNIARHTASKCDPFLLIATGDPVFCYDNSKTAWLIADVPVNDPQAAIPSDSAPWGIHLSYFGSNNYVISWFTGSPTITPNWNLTQPDTSKLLAMVKFNTTDTGSDTPTLSLLKVAVGGKVITYARNYTSGPTNSSYLSPLISHVMLKNLRPGRKYFYSVGNGKVFSPVFSFKTLPTTYKSRTPSSYPLRVGLIADVGQTFNSTATRDQLIANNPDVIFHIGDLTYSDNYAGDDGGVLNSGPPSFTRTSTKGGTNQMRWDAWEQIWSPLFRSVPTLHVAGNHEIESGGIKATINYTTESFSFPNNYPFQSYSARHPTPRQSPQFSGDITTNQYYSVEVGPVKFVSLNNYIPFHKGSAQYTWWQNEMDTNFSRERTPWLIVAFHTPIYHTYFVHYKEADCFRSVYEPDFYKYGVDIVLSGHVHAYERTHPMYDYKLDTCGPMYLTVGDGGNIEGPYRNFVDEIWSTPGPNQNKTYCELLNYGGKGPNSAPIWGPGYQTQAHIPGCPTITFQQATGASGGIKGGAGLVPSSSDPSSFFCQSSQPVWSAHRDPSYGHSILNIIDDTTVEFGWYRNRDGQAVAADTTLLQRVPLQACSNKLAHANF